MKMYFRILLMQLLFIPSLYCGKIYLDSIVFPAEDSSYKIYWTFLNSRNGKLHFLTTDKAPILLHEFYTREEAGKIFSTTEKKTNKEVDGEYLKNSYLRIRRNSPLSFILNYAKLNWESGGDL